MVAAKRARVSDRGGTITTASLDVIHGIGSLTATGNDADASVDRQPSIGVQCFDL